ncbi:MAG: hypothetical protein JW782_06830 [Candidatus Saganbacteria bacterium]|nr:hypothetical protein [Candidatus Saganbacteria bacterium]
MVYAINPKQMNAVIRVMNQLGRGRRRRVITLSSERRLSFLAGVMPNQTRAFLKNLLSLDQAGRAPQKIIVPDGLYASTNRALLVRLADLEQIQEMMTEGEVLDLSKQGIKRKLGYIDRVPNINEPSLGDEIATLRQPQAVTELARGAVLANLFLFRSLMAARIEVYNLGEAKSAARRSGYQDKYAYACGKVRDYAALLREFCERFPFDNIDNSQKVRDDLLNASLWLEKLNNPVVDNILVTLSARILEDLERAEAARFRNALSKQDRAGLHVANGKVRIIDSWRGDCVITGSGYKKSAAGILGKEMIDHNVTSRKILSMIDHEIESAGNEKEKNTALIEELKSIADEPLAWFDKLLEANLLLAQVRDTGKRKALVELTGARSLLSIPGEQSHGLAGQLVKLAVRDLERRNQVLDAQVARLTGLRVQTEELLGDVLKSLANRWAGYFAQPNRNLRDLKRLDLIKKRLGKYLGTLLGPKKDDLRQPWMRQARSHITGVLRLMSGAVKAMHELERANQQRLAMLRIARPGAEQRFQLRVLEGEIEKLEEKVTGSLAGLNIKAARLLLRIEFDFINRARDWKKGERQAALRVFYRSKTAEYGPAIAL